jgi:hypothetical protein
LFGSRKEDLTLGRVKEDDWMSTLTLCGKMSSCCEANGGVPELLGLCELHKMSKVDRSMAKEKDRKAKIKGKRTVYKCTLILLPFSFFYLIQRPQRHNCTNLRSFTCYPKIGRALFSL